MNFFSILASGVVGLAKGLFGGGSSGSNQNLVGTLADKILPETAKEKEAAALAGAEEDVKDEVSARSYQAPDMPMVTYMPGMGLIPWFLTWLLDLYDHIIDSINHTIRPLGIIWAALVISGKIPDPSVSDPKMWTVFLTMVSFFYGGRAFVKDILPGLKDLLKK